MLEKAINVVAILVLPWLYGCGQSNLYIAYDTVIGINAAVNTQRTAGHLIIGYDRDFITLVPKSVEPPPELIPDSKGGKEAMSVLSCSDLKINGIFLTEFTEYLGTGEAARIYAEEIATNKGGEVFSCLKEQKGSDQR